MCTLLLPNGLTAVMGKAFGFNIGRSVVVWRQLQERHKKLPKTVISSFSANYLRFWYCNTYPGYHHVTAHVLTILNRWAWKNNMECLWWGCEIIKTLKTNAAQIYWNREYFCLRTTLSLGSKLVPFGRKHLKVEIWKLICLAEICWLKEKKRGEIILCIIFDKHK